MREKEIGLLLAPFSFNSLQRNIIISPLQTVSKKNTDDTESRRIVLDLSYPKHSSVNVGIPKDLYLGIETKLS